MVGIDRKEFIRFVGRRIAEERAKAGYTQTSFAEHVGIAAKNVQRYEQGQNVKLETLLKIADALDVVPADLLLPARDEGETASPPARGPLAELAAMGWPVSSDVERAPPRSVPILDLIASGGPLGEARSVRPIGCVILHGRRGAPPEGSFVARVQGESMEPLVPSGAFCLFRPATLKPMIDTVVLVKRWETGDPDDGAAFALMRVGALERDEDHHLTVRLDSLNLQVRPSRRRPRAALPARDAVRHQAPRSPSG